MIDYLPYFNGEELEITEEICGLTTTTMITSTVPIGGEEEQTGASPVNIFYIGNYRALIHSSENPFFSLCSARRDPPDLRFSLLVGLERSVFLRLCLLSDRRLQIIDGTT